ncbi:MAG: NADP oxidoreductase [Deltaproteobacteria bacterium]|nr:MAG: NADP oxidoreductase [Deltaproteobacteria bacterium]
MKHHNSFSHGRRILCDIVAMVALFLALGTLPGAVFGQAATGSAAMKIGIIGSGNIGSTVGTLWVKAGHQVLFSSRHPEELKPLVDGLGPLARAGTVHDALTFSDVIFIGVPYGAYPQIAKDYGKEFVGKIVLDAGNAVLARDGEIAKPARENGVALTSAKLLAGARIVRAFNIMSFRKVASNANRPEGRIAMPMAGDDPEALKVASGLVRDAGFDPVIVGSLQRSKLFEQGGPLYGAEISAQEMRERLKTLP